MKIKGMRWWIVGLLFFAAVLNYVDRQTLSALAPTIQKDLDMNEQDYANVVNIFLVAYTFAYLLSGRIADKMGTRKGMFVFVAWWSIANVFTAAANSIASLSVNRFALGLGEAGIWPAASKAVSEWFPKKERAFAIGLYIMGATIGATVAPYIVIPLATYSYASTFPVFTDWLGQGTGWRFAFILTGVAGLVWLIPWLLVYRQTATSKRITEDALQLIIDDAASDDPADSAKENTWSWKQVLLFKGTWLLQIGRLVTDPVWYFYQFWFPKYLSSDRHLSQEQLKITWVIYAAAGSTIGGIMMNTIVAAMVSVTPAKAAGFLDKGLHTLLNPILNAVQGHGYAWWFFIMAFLHPVGWLILKFGGIQKLSKS
jgi:ACS family hexuronate transporter-like MFS transporter